MREDRKLMTMQEGDILKVRKGESFKLYSVCYNWKNDNLILLPHYDKELLKDSSFSLRQYKEILDLSSLKNVDKVEIIKKGTEEFLEIESQYQHKESFISEGVPVPFGTSSFFDIELKFNDVFFSNISPRTRTRRLSKIINQFKHGSERLRYYYSRTNRLILL